VVARAEEEGVNMEILTLKQKFCGNCQNMMVVEGGLGICKVKERIVHKNYLCPLHDEGLQVEADVETIAKYYLFFKELEEEAKKNKDILRDILIRIGSKATDNYEIFVSKVTTKRLDTEKVKEYLGDKINDFLKISEYYRVDVKRRWFNEEKVD